MRKYLRAIWLVAVLIMVQGCGGEKVVLEERTLENVQAVFYHEQSRYTVLVREGENRLVPLSYRTTRVDIFDDVPATHAMWAYVVTVVEDGVESSELSIHVHSVHDINGAGWNHGKFGTGTTVRITP